MNGGLTALPNRNLVDNIGYGVNATHTQTQILDTSVLQGIDGNLKHPSFLLRDCDADSYLSITSLVAGCLNPLFLFAPTKETNCILL